MHTTAVILCLHIMYCTTLTAVGTYHLIRVGYGTVLEVTHWTVDWFNSFLHKSLGDSKLSSGMWLKFSPRYLQWLCEERQGQTRQL